MAQAENTRSTQTRNIGIAAHIDAGKTTLHRAHPFLYRPRAQDGRSARRRGDDGLDGARARARHHDHLRRDDLHLARHAHQHHRYARPRGLHGRGRALAARARRPRRALRLGRGGAAAVRDRLAPGQQVQSAAHHLRQQDGSHRVPTSSTSSRRFASVWARAPFRSRCRSAPKTSSKASSTSLR